MRCAIAPCRLRRASSSIPAAVCIYPRFVGQARARVHGSGIAVAAVANFPLGTATVGEVIAEVEQALADGADEIDVVFPFRAYLAGDHSLPGELVRPGRRCRATAARRQR